MAEHGELIIDLPVDDIKPTSNELELVNLVFKKNIKGNKKLVDELKNVLIIGVLFIVFSIPKIDETIHRIIPSSVNSVYITTLIKAIVFMILYWILKNFALSQSK
jgi:hypothetical protein